MRGVALVVLIAACGESSGIPIEDYAAAERAWQCRYDVQCGLLADLATCDATNIGWYWTVPELIEAVHAGVVHWDADAAQRCLEQEVSCDITSDAHYRRCDPLTSGTLHEGEACNLAAECISQECWTEPCYGVCCVGYCVGDKPPVRGHIGDPCRFAECLEGYCNASVCLPRLAEGAICSLERQCAEGLGCAPMGTEYRCKRLPYTGEVCSGACAMDGDRCGLSGRCEPGATGGQPCTADTDCSELYRCGPNQRCIDAGAAIGESCLSTGRCADLDAFCDTPTGKCYPRYPIEITDCGT
jgi:hypothetical protein